MILVFFVFGLCLGSFINAWVWRLSQQLDADGNPIKGKVLRAKSPNSQPLTSNQYSVVHGRSMCPHCKHSLAWYDLIPVLSWLSLGGKCRYCKKPISRQYPLIELLTAALFAISYIFWPLQLSETWVVVSFATWLCAVVGLVALAVFDSKYMLLPNRILYPTIAIVATGTALQFATGRPMADVSQIVLACLVAGGIFWLLFKVSQGRWIGYGDVKLGILAGLLLSTPTMAFLYLFVASMLGLLYSLPLMAAGKLTKTSKVPFGPFLIASLYIVVLWGGVITDWYAATFLPV